MKLTRYTVNGVGIFRKLQLLFNEVDMEVADEVDLYAAEDVFEERMIVPDVCTDKTIQSTSWFTEKGMIEFEDAIDTILLYASLYLDASVKKEVIEYDRPYLYKDDLQVVIAKKGGGEKI